MRTNRTPSREVQQAGSWGGNLGILLCQPLAALCKPHLPEHCTASRSRASEWVWRELRSPEIPEPKLNLFLSPVWTQEGGLRPGLGTASWLGLALPWLCRTSLAQNPNPAWGDEVTLPNPENEHCWAPYSLCAAQRRNPNIPTASTWLTQNTGGPFLKQRTNPGIIVKINTAKLGSLSSPPQKGTVKSITRSFRLTFINYISSARVKQRFFDLCIWNT